MILLPLASLQIHHLILVSCISPGDLAKVLIISRCQMQVEDPVPGGGGKEERAKATEQIMSWW
jgi:hypothetical protein